MFDTILGRIIGITLLILVFIPTVNADNYKVVLKKITPESISGDVIIEFKPGRKEDRFSGKAKARLLGSDLGTNRSLAVLLAAASLGTEAIIELPAIPSNDVIQIVISTGIAP